MKLPAKTGCSWAEPLVWCFLTVDTVLFAPVWGYRADLRSFSLWYLLLLTALGRRVFHSWESCVLLMENLVLAATFALQSNPRMRWWNLLALLVLVPIHTCGLCASTQLPRWRPRMLSERTACWFFRLVLRGGCSFCRSGPHREGSGFPPDDVLCAWLRCSRFAAVHSRPGACLRRCPLCRRHSGPAHVPPDPFHHDVCQVPLGPDPDSFCLQSVLSPAPPGAARSTFFRKRRSLWTARDL